ncbi:MAG: hypothetical protein JKX85_15925, partial [Phycisphaeraceae bacterium]|nr:hypothetical protein [Phycisphaeraceae bacterium]
MTKLLVPFSLGFSGSNPIQLGTTGTFRFKKDAIRVGQFIARNPIDGTSLLLEVTPQRISSWIEQFQFMRGNGVQVDLTVDHKKGAAAKIGTVDYLYRDDETLMFDLTVPDKESVLLLERCPEVSIEIEPGFQDGKGHIYGEAITAITVCRKPVVGDQQPFVPIAASLQGAQSDTAAPHRIFFSLNQHDVPPEGFSENHNSKQESPMLTKEQITDAKKKLGLADDVADSVVAQKIMLSLDDPTGLTELQAELDKAKQANTDLTAKLAAGPAAPVQLSREVVALSTDA